MRRDGTLRLLEKSKLLPKVQGEERRVPVTWGRSSSGDNDVVTETLMMRNGAAEEQMMLSGIGAR